MGQDQKPDRRYQSAADQLHSPEVLLEAPVERQELIQAKARQKKRHAQPERVNPEQKDALADGLLLFGDCRDAGKNWPNTRRPAEGERQSQDQRASRAARPAHVMEALIPVQHIDSKDAQQVKSENNDDDAGNL